jgi:hypothetical protein
MTTSNPLLKRLLNRQDKIFIDNGQLLIEPASKNTVPDQWMIDNQESLALSIGILCNVNILRYDDYSTGNYSSKRAGGVNLQFFDLITGLMGYAIFNADLTRARNTAYGTKGTPLSSGKFSVGKRSSFYKFWCQAGLIAPKRLSTFSDQMGLLKVILFTGDYDKGERLSKNSIRPANISHEQIINCACNSLDNLPTISRQLTDNVPTRTPDKEMTESHAPRALQAVSTTGDANYGNTFTRECGYKGKPIPVNDSYRRITEQSNSEWLEGYESTN